MADDQAGVASVRIKSDERTFKTLGDEILRMIATNDAERLKRSALVNSARTFVENRVIHDGFDPESSYRPLEYYMTSLDFIRPFTNIDLVRIKRWLQWNLDIFERKSKGGLVY